MKKGKICYYCTHFHADVDSIIARADGEEIIVKSKCPIKNTIITDSDEACNKFNLVDYFYCSKKEQRAQMKLCLARREKKMEGCVRCSQGKYIEEVLLDARK